MKENAHLKQKQESVFTASDGLGQSEWSGVKNQAKEEARRHRCKQPGSCRGLCKNFPLAKLWKSSSWQVNEGRKPGFRTDTDGGPG